MGLTGWSTSNYLRKTTTVYGTEPFCFFAWISLASAPASFCGAVQIGTNNSNPRYAIELTTAPTLGLNATNGGVQLIQASTNVTTDGVWNHALAGVISSTSRVVERNGGSTATGATSVVITAGAVWIGVRQLGGPAIDAPLPATAGIAEVSVWGGSMSQTNMQDLAQKLFNGGAAGAGGNPLNITAEASQPWSGQLKAYWPLTNTSDLADASGNGHTLTMVGTLSNHASHPTIESTGPAGPTLTMGYEVRTA